MIIVTLSFGFLFGTQRQMTLGEFEKGGSSVGGKCGGLRRHETRSECSG